MKRLLHIFNAATLLLFTGCVPTASCRSRVTGELVAAKRLQYDDGWAYRDSNDVPQKIVASNSDQWECRS